MAPGLARRLPGWLPLACAGALAVLLYRPWHARAFDVLDFSEFLPLLNGAHGAARRFAALVDYYGQQHGRFNIVGYAALAAKWTWLGAEPLRWQWLRVGELLLIAGLVYALLRRLAANAVGAGFGAVLFLFSYSAGLVWVRQTMGEPLGLLCALVAALAATRLDVARRSWAPALTAGLAIAAAVLTKEMLAAWVPVVMLIAIGRNADGKLERWRFDARARAVLAATAIGGIAAALLVVRTALRSSGEGYAATYGHAPRSLSRLGELFQRQFFPWPITGRSDGVVLLGAALLFLAVIGLGMRAGLRDPAWRKHCRRVILVGLALPLAGAAAYLPWPVYAPFYGFAFLFGPALLLATAVSVLTAQGGRARWIVPAACCSILLLIAPQSVRLAQVAEARQEVMTAVARALSGEPAAKRIVVAVPLLPAQAWQGIAPTLARYAAAQPGGHSMPPAEDMLCGDAGRLLQSGGDGTLLVSFSDSCGEIPGPTLMIRQQFNYWRWEPPGLGHDSLRADVAWLPGVPR
jgi:hypothetical protein